jgi:hypothetical protein
MDAAFRQAEHFERVAFKVRFDQPSREHADAFPSAHKL